MDDLKSFTYVLAVAECKSISKAAELLYISQPSLSRFISSLEQELGILLFERKSNGINLTEAGEIYVAYGKEIKRLNSTMEHELKELQLSEEQEIHVCMSLNASLLLAMEVQEKISKKYIGCKVTFSNVMAKEILTGLKNRTYDLAIGPDLSEKDSSIVFDFIVEDNGIGMEQSFIERIFEPFIRAEDSRVSKIQGTGLGMTISLNLAKLMNGSIDVESCVGKGSKITASVCLKVQRQNGVAVEYEQPAGDNENAADIDYSGKRVLVVEDNAINLEIALEFLKLLGLTCESAGDGAEALEKLLAAPEGYYDLFI